MGDIKYILFDAANTVIHKPELWTAIQEVLTKYGYSVSDNKIRLHHKLLSELTTFPDRTSREFYRRFNYELLISLGIIPSVEMQDELFTRCSYLPWRRFDDTQWLNSCRLPIGVLSNFNSGLPGILTELFGDLFAHIIPSESVDARKPDIAFYKHASDVIGLPVSNILYVGDSVKLDLEPALRLGLKAFLIDRDGFYLAQQNRISSLNELNRLVW